MAFLLVRATDQPTGCTSLASGGDEPAREITLVVELLGNTEEDGEQAAGFASDQLTWSAESVTENFDVNLRLISYGESVPTLGCLSATRRLESPGDDLNTFNNERTSQDTKQALGDQLREVRRQQIQWVTDGIYEAVRAVPFTDEDASNPELSPRLAWEGALQSDSADTIIAVFSPLISTIDDCFASTPTSDGDQEQLSARAEAAVSDCLRFGQVAISTSDATSIVANVGRLDTGQREQALATRQAMCSILTPDDCSETPV